MIKTTVVKNNDIKGSIFIIIQKLKNLIKLKNNGKQLKFNLYYFTKSQIINGG